MQVQKTHTHMNIPRGVRHDDMELAQYRVVKSPHITIYPLRQPLEQKLAFLPMLVAARG
jgi:hypothetical protein